ncbi:MAG: hypothetical protein KJ915_07180 [Candidatus Omnitrophica bacterium]|nr:hypothetical protein [Candidatus Omnitrophota bacterium]
MLVDEDASFNYYKVIEQRNFFRPKKDQPEIGSIPIETNIKQEKDSLDLILTGVIEIKNGYKAIVEQKSTKKGFYVSVNEAIEDYTVKSIMLNKIIIQKDGKDFELKLQQAAQQKNSEPTTEKTEINIEQEPVIMEEDLSPPTLRANTIQQIRSGTRGTK